MKVDVTLLYQLIEAAIRVRFKHPGSQPVGREYHYCVVCQGEWFAEAPVRHKLLHRGSMNYTCPVKTLEEIIKEPT